MRAHHFTSFLYDDVDHGGVLRSRQLAVYFECELDCEILVLNIGNTLKFSLGFARELMFLLLRFKFLSLSLKTIVKKAFVKNFILDWYAKEYSVGDLVLVEQSAGFDLFACDILIGLGVKYSLYPHNVEFCVSDQSLVDDGYCYEVVKRSYVFATSVFVISHLDKMIVDVYSDSVIRLDYVGDLSLSVEGCDGLNVEDEYYFISFGSVCNPPTKKGMKKLIDLFKNDDFFPRSKLYVAGFGAEILSPFGHARAIVLGELKDKELQDYIERSAGVIIYQVPTTGWLTKIEGVLAMNKKIYINSSYAQAKLKYGDDIKFYDA